MHTHTRWKTNNAKTVSKVLSRQTGTVEQLYMYNDTWALLVIESASSRMIILKGGQGWPLCGCVGVREEGCVCMVVRGKGRGEGRWEMHSLGTRIYILPRLKLHNPSDLQGN